MLLLATADIHIYPYIAKSKLINGVPSRLFLFNDLAEKIASIATDKKVDCIVLAGDISHTHQVDGVIGTTIQNFIRILLDSSKVLLIDGNHDINLRYTSKGADIETSVLYPLLSPFFNNANFYYNISFEDLYPYSYLDILTKGLEGFEPDTSKVFVSHAFVTSATLPSGLKIKSGFDLGQLLDSFKLSIIGDIHKGQILGDRVLIPGTPIQHSEKDALPTGVWLVDTDKCLFEFIEIGDEKFPRFIPRARNSSDDKRKFDLDYQPVETGDIDSLVFDELQSSVKALKIENEDKKDLLNLLDKYRNELKQEVSKKTGFIEINSVYIDSFGCLKDRFISLDKSPLVIVGHNGVGKSTICESIAWVLFNKAPSKTYIDDVVSDETGYARVVLECNVGSEKFLISRCRSCKDFNNGLYLGKGDISALDSVEWVLKKDDFISDIVGLSFDVFLSFYYHYQDKTSLLTKKNVDLLIEFFGSIYDFSFLDRLREWLDKDISSLKSELSVLSGKVSQLEEIINREKVLEIEEDIDAKISSLMLEIEQIENNFKELSEANKILSQTYRDLDKRNYEAVKAEELLKKIPNVDVCRSCSLVSHAYTAVDARPSSKEYETISGMIKEQEILLSNLRKLLSQKREEVSRYKIAKEIASKIEEYKKELAVRVKEKESLSNKLDKYLALYKVVGKKGITSVLASKVLNSLDIDTPFLSVSFEPVKTKAGKLKGGIEPIVHLKKKGLTVNYSRLSGGEKLLVDITVLVKILEIAYEKKVGFNLLIIDEGSKFLDELYLDSLSEVLLDTNLSVLLVTHLMDFASRFENLIVF